MIVMGRKGNDCYGEINNHISDLTRMVHSLEIKVTCIEADVKYLKSFLKVIGITLFTTAISFIVSILLKII